MRRRRDDLKWLPLRSSHNQRKRAAPNAIFTGGVVKGNCICSAAFCESAALRAGARSPSGELSRSD